MLHSYLTNAIDSAGCFGKVVKQVARYDYEVSFDDHEEPTIMTWKKLRREATGTTDANAPCALLVNKLSLFT